MKVYVAFRKYPGQEPDMRLFKRKHDAENLAEFRTDSWRYEECSRKGWVQEVEFDMEEPADEQS